jgi:hypothetical protein
MRFMSIRLTSPKNRVRHIALEMTLNPVESKICQERSKAIQKYRRASVVVTRKFVIMSVVTAIVESRQSFLAFRNEPRTFK